MFKFIKTQFRLSRMAEKSAEDVISLSERVYALESKECSEQCASLEAEVKLLYEYMDLDRPTKKDG